MSSLPFDEIEEHHLRLLIDNSIPEARDLDFKQAAIGNADADKREFLKDVTSFANTSGGHVVIGVAENAGIADHLVGLTTRSADEEILRLESMLLAAVEPRLFGVRMKGVVLSSTGYALVVRVPQSWNPPHRVNHGGVNRYYLRHSAGAYEPVVDQLRAVFLGGADVERRLLEFRLERLARLTSGERGLALCGRGQLLIQTVPMLAGASSFLLPAPTEAVSDFRQSGGSSFSHRHNLEGLLLYSVSSANEGSTRAYTQIFRDGRVEMACGGFVRESASDPAGPPVVASGKLVANIIASARRCLSGASKHGAAFPMALMVSFIDALGTRLPVSSYDFGGAELLDRSDLLFAPIMFEEGQDLSNWDCMLLPVLNALWNAYGYGRCHPVLDETGEWKGLPPNWAG